MVHLLQTGGVGSFAYVWYELGKWTIRLLLFMRSKRTLMLSITNRRKSLDLCVHDSLWPWRPCVLRSPFLFFLLLSSPAFPAGREVYGPEVKGRIENGNEGRNRIKNSFWLTDLGIQIAC